MLNWNYILSSEKQSGEAVLYALYSDMVRMRCFGYILTILSLRNLLPV